MILQPKNNVGLKLILVGSKLLLTIIIFFTPSNCNDGSVTSAMNYDNMVTKKYILNKIVQRIIIYITRTGPHENQ